MTEEQKEKMKNLFNFYSYKQASEGKKGLSDEMWTLKNVAVEIFGYNFKFEKTTTTADGIKYSLYKLVEINE